MKPPEYLVPVKPALDYPTCREALLEALRNYIRVNDDLRLEYLRAGDITVQQAKDDVADMQRFVLLLTEMEGDTLAPLGRIYSVKP